MAIFEVYTMPVYGIYEIGVRNLSRWIDRFEESSGNSASGGKVLRSPRISGQGVGMVVVV